MNYKGWLGIENKYKCLPPLGSSSAVVLPACANPGARGAGQEAAIEEGKRRETLVKAS